ncbi:MAG: small multi-drug export protein [SAR202 cluster bacterium]|nr:small multi-drug export protein [SAR202 cluster bacterium]
MSITDILITMGTAAAPVGELRAAIPLAMVEFGAHWYEAFLWGTLGNFIPALVLPFVLYRLGHLLLKSPQPFRGVILWRIGRLKKGGGAWAHKHGGWTLILLGAAPLPFAGIWTSCLAAWAMDLHPKRSIPYLLLGSLSEAIIVLVLVQLGVSLLKI